MSVNHSNKISRMPKNNILKILPEILKILPLKSIE